MNGSVTGIDQARDNNRNNPFKRGALTFEDYNYKMYNPYILVNDIDSSAEMVYGQRKVQECSRENL